MKKLSAVLALLLCFAFVVPTSIASNAADELTASVSDGSVLSGTAKVTFHSSGNSLSVKLDGKDVDCEQTGSFELACTASGLDYTNSVFVADGKTIATLSQNGAQRFALENSLFDGDELRITLLPSVGSSGALDTSKPYGSYNIDDMQLSGLCIRLPSGEEVMPSELIMCYPIVGNAGVTEKSVQYTGGQIAVGDGWTAATGMGGSTPNQAICFVAVFDLKDSDTSLKPGCSLVSYIDTTAYDDGSHTFTLTSNGSSRDITVSFDNTPPVITCTLQSGALLSPDALLSATAEDASDCTVEYKIDGKTYREGKPVKNFVTSAKTHTFTAVATDSAGNSSALVLEFMLASGEEYSSFTAGEGSTLDAEGSLYKVEELEASSDGSTFYVSCGDAQNLMLRYSGKSAEGLLIKLYVQLPDGSLEHISDVASGDDVYIPVTVKPEYVADGKIAFKAEEHVYTSESNTMVWITDTQYYTRFDDLFEKYTAALDYYADLYAKGEAGFLLHTGDVADEYSPQDKITAQMTAASQLHEVLDNAGLPYGIVNGNHDVGQHLHDSSYFSKYFGASRFADTSWYYGSLNNNESHYDLVTLGGFDFVLVWLGYGVEADPETLAWATDVLQRYSHRNAIILTHSYLDTDGDWVLNYENPEDYTHSRAPEIWNELVVPNENVVAVFCGHTPGVSRNLRRVGDTDRYVWEVLADYQFYTDGEGATHYMNGCYCDGEGFVRIVTFTGSEMTQTTYSPYTGKKNPFGAADEFTVELKLKPAAQRSLETAAFEAFEVLESAEHKGSAQIDAGSYLLAAGEYSLKDPTADQSSADSSNDSTTPSGDASAADAPPSHDSGWNSPNTMTIVVVVVCVLAVCAVTAVVIIASKKRKQK